MTLYGSHRTLYIVTILHPCTLRWDSGFRTSNQVHKPHLLSSNMVSPWSGHLATTLGRQAKASLLGTERLCDEFVTSWNNAEPLRINGSRGPDCYVAKPRPMFVTIQDPQCD
jgi:hypothetical protein